jgi:hypothetical protein
MPNKCGFAARILTTRKGLHVPPLRRGCSIQRLEQSSDFAPNKIANGAKFFRRERFRVWDVPIFAAFCTNQWTGIAATHRRDKVELDVRKIDNRFRALPAEIAAQLAHCLNRLRIDDARRSGTGAVGFYLFSTMDARESLCHLAPVRILHTHE